MIGLLCPGQGSQYVGMGRDLAEAHAVAAQTFADADRALGFPLSRLCWEGPEEELTRTSNAQPAILVHTIAVWRVIAERRPIPIRVAAGHSLGEFSAYVAAGSLDFMDAVRLVRTRGELMYRAGQERPGSMYAVLGLDDAAAEEVCRRASGGGVVVPANYNAPGQIVISGDSDAVQVAADLAKEAGAKRAIPLAVSGAFHSPLVESAATGLQRALDLLQLSDPAFPVVSNVTARPVGSADEVRPLLFQQITAPVRWVQSIRTMIEFGASRFVEMGPGNVLTGLLRRIERSVEARSIGTAQEIAAYIGEG